MKRVLFGLFAATTTFLACAEDEPELNTTPDSAVILADGSALPPGPGAGTAGAEAGPPSPALPGGGTSGGGNDATVPLPTTTGGGATDAGAVVDTSVPTPTDGGGSTLPPTPGDGKQPRIPAKPAQCPEIKTGMITVLGQQVQLTVGPKQPGQKGPNRVLLAWHG